MELVIPIIAGIIKTIITSIPYGIKISKSKFDKKYFSISKKVFMFIVFASFLYKKFWIIHSLKIEKSMIFDQKSHQKRTMNERIDKILKEASKKYKKSFYSKILLEFAWINHR